MKKLDRKKIYIYQNDVPKSYEARQQFTDEVTKRGYTIVDSYDETVGLITCIGGGTPAISPPVLLSASIRGIWDSSRKFCRRIFPASWIPTRNRNTPCRISGPSMQSSTR